MYEWNDTDLIKSHPSNHYKACRVAVTAPNLSSVCGCGYEDLTPDELVILDTGRQERNYLDSGKTIRRWHIRLDTKDSGN